MIEEALKIKWILNETFESYLEFKDNGGKDIDKFLNNKLKTQEIYIDEKEVAEIIKDIDETLNRIDTNHKEISNYKSKGFSTSRWIEDKVDELISQYSIEGDDAFPKLLDLVFERENSNISKNIFSIPMAMEITKLDSYVFEDLNKKAVSNKLHQTFQQNTALNLMVSGFSVSDIYSAEKDIIMPLKNYVESKMDNPEDVIIKKIVTIAAVAASEQGLIKPLEGKSVVELATIIDSELTQIKIGYKIAKGEINVLEAIDYLIDRTTARVETVVSHSCRKAGGFIGEKVGQIVGTVFGPVGTVVGGLFGRIIGESVGQTVGQKVNIGLSKIADTSKDICRNVYEGAREFASNTWSGIKSIFD